MLYLSLTLSSLRAVMSLKEVIAVLYCCRVVVLEGNPGGNMGSADHVQLSIEISSSNSERVFILAHDIVM